MEKFISYRDGLLHIENVSAKDIFKQKDDSDPVYVFSKNGIVSNVQQYVKELDKHFRNYTVNYSMKANANPAILEIIKEHGCSLTLVSGLELQLALEQGFPPYDLVFNGNGKEAWEIDLAIRNNVLLNIDSVFNMEQTIASCRKMNTTARILLRVNPNIEVDVHQYVSTGNTGSKFGLDEVELEKVLAILSSDTPVELVGLHCHLGSTIDNLDKIADATEKLVELFKHLQNERFSNLKYLNIGGGLGIPYRISEWETQPWCSIDESFKNNLENLFSEDCRDGEFQKAIQLFRTNQISFKTFMDMIQEKSKGFSSKFINELKENSQKSSEMPTPADLIRKVKSYWKDDIHLIIEPGRSLVGNTAVLLCRVLGCKQSGNKHFVVVNAAMTEIIRPSLYDAYHHIDLAEPNTSKTRNLYDIVGPVCESSDFLGKNRILKTPKEGSLMAIFDVGAYCGSMGMTYNMRRRPAEFMVDGNSVKIIRRADKYEDLMAPFRM